jgi:hypothetical protein
MYYDIYCSIKFSDLLKNPLNNHPIARNERNFYQRQNDTSIDCSNTKHQQKFNFALVCYQLPQPTHYPLAREEDNIEPCHLYHYPLRAAFY